jgi:hypothetical protein
VQGQRARRALKALKALKVLKALKALKALRTLYHEMCFLAHERLAFGKSDRKCPPRDSSRIRAA